MGEIKIDNRRGRHVWVPYEGIAIRMDQPSELIRDLYAKVAIIYGLNKVALCTIQ
jgi:hypothetical protein